MSDQTDNTGDKARKLFVQPCEMVMAAAEAHQFPSGKVPEIALAGRSNVGKSSLINALVGRRNLARTSNTPGRTQQIFFYNIVDRLMLVDLPGYGHAEAPAAERERWNQLVYHYLQSRPNLRCVTLLIDSRHGALANDLTMMQFLDRAGMSYQIVLTKIDQVKPVERETRPRQVAAMLAKHPAARSEVIVTSSEKNIGIEPLRNFFAGFAI
jgi:GTP-binding protein